MCTPESRACFGHAFKERIPAQLQTSSTQGRLFHPEGIAPLKFVEIAIVRVIAGDSLRKTNTAAGRRFAAQWGQEEKRHRGERYACSWHVLSDLWTKVLPVRIPGFQLIVGFSFGIFLRALHPVAKKQNAAIRNEKSQFSPNEGLHVTCVWSFGSFCVMRQFWQSITILINTGSCVSCSVVLDPDFRRYQRCLKDKLLFCSPRLSEKLVSDMSRLVQQNTLVRCKCI